MKKGKNSKKRVSRPFDGLIRQLCRETVCLVNLKDVPAFVSECSRRGISTRGGSFYEDGIIVVKED